MQRLMGASGNPPVTTSVGSRSIKLTPNTGLKKISTSAPSGSSGGWKTVGAPAKKSTAELSWGNNGEDLYDPTYPTPL
jgi:hypothetical protein